MGDRISYVGEYIAANGTCVVPQTFKLSNGYKLGGWVSTQRVKHDKLTPGRVARLEALCGWVWDRFDDKWETGFDHLRDYSLENGHCLVPYSYKLPDGYKLGIWVGSQQRRRDHLTPERKARLEALQGCIWKVREDD